MKSLITGSGGFAGSHLAEYLQSQGEEVIGLVARDENPTLVKPPAGLTRVERADLRDANQVAAILAEMRPDRIYHLAALSSPADSLQDPRSTFDVNFGGTLNILLGWRKAQFDCRMLVVSSSDVYGNIRNEELPLREDSALRPANPYAASKVACEILAAQFHRSYGLPIVCARPFNHTGPRQSPRFVCSSIAKQIAEINAGLRSPSISVGNMNLRRDFSDVRDIVRGYHLLMEKGFPGETYLLCSGCAVTIEYIVHTLVAMASEPIQIVLDSSMARGQESPVLYGDPSKACRMLGWRREYDLESTLRDLERYWEGVLGA